CFNYTGKQERKKLIQFIYLPMTILTALLLQSLLTFKSGSFPSLRFPEILACIPALIVGIRTNDLMKIVLTGVVAIALLRLL
uniref:AzlD domain-containing protein n=1 Tax=Enterococcus devriesei TaxID=319970 RepID=UPI0028ADB232